MQQEHHHHPHHRSGILSKHTLEESETRLRRSQKGRGVEIPFPPISCFEGLTLYFIRTRVPVLFFALAPLFPNGNPNTTGQVGHFWWHVHPSKYFVEALKFVASIDMSLTQSIIFEKYVIRGCIQFHLRT